MSKTERDLAADGSADALDELFDDTDFDDALESALEAAESDVPRNGDHPGDDAAEAAAVVVEEIEDDATGEHDTLEHDAVDDDTAEAAVIEVEEPDDVADEELEAADEVVEVHDTDAQDDTDAVDAAALDDAVIEDEAAEDTEVDELPEIVQATPDEPLDESDGEQPDGAVAFVEEEVEQELDADEVAEEILEELRRADIDGPQVEMAPQDETTAARRRPRRAVDYDPAPVPIPTRVPRVLARKPRVRRVTRVVRHVDPWSVFKIALVANLVLYVIILTAGVLLWNVAHATGTVDNVERFFESFGWQSFEFNGGEIYHASWIAGLFVVIGLTGMAVLLATLFNLITDLVGGVRFTVLEEEVVETRTSPLRRFVVRRPEPDVPARLNDPSGAMIREAVVDDTSANQRPSR